MPEHEPRHSPGHQRRRCVLPDKLVPRFMPAGAVRLHEASVDNMERDVVRGIVAMMKDCTIQVERAEAPPARATELVHAA